MIEGELDAKGLRFGVVVSRFNGFITEPLMVAAVDTLLRHGAASDDIVVVRVPGAWEIPQAAARLCERPDIDAVIALGCLMRGDTIHFDLIAGEVTKGLGALSRGRVPVAFGVLTTDGLEQSIHRAGAKHGNKGGEAAMAAIEQARVCAALRRGGEGAAATTTGGARPRGKRR